MGFTGEAALQFKLMYIDAFNKMENALKKVAKPDSYMIEDPVKRAERWIEEAKERQELEHKNEKLQDKIDKDADWRDHWVALRQSAKQ
jgi:anti-repressor protein